MSRNGAYRWMTVALVMGLALAFGLASGCYGRNPLNPNYVPGDSLHPNDSTPSQGWLRPPPSGVRALV